MPEAEALSKELDVKSTAGLMNESDSQEEKESKNHPQLHPVMDMQTKMGNKATSNLVQNKASGQTRRRSNTIATTQPTRFKDNSSIEKKASNKIQDRLKAMNKSSNRSELQEDSMEAKQASSRKRRNAVSLNEEEANAVKKEVIYDRQKRRNAISLNDQEAGKIREQLKERNQEAETSDIKEGTIATKITDFFLSGNFDSLVKVRNLVQTAKRSGQLENIRKLSDEKNEEMQAEDKEGEESATAPINDLEWVQKLKDNLKAKAYKEAEEMIVQKLGFNPSKVFLKAIQFVIKNFKLKKALEITGKLLEWVGPISNGIKTVHSGGTAIKQMYTAFKNRKDTSGAEKVQDGLKISQQVVQTAGHFVNTVASTMKILDVAGDVLGTVVPIVGSVINMVTKGITIAMKTFYAIKSFFFQKKMGSQTKGFKNQEENEKYKIQSYIGKKLNKKAINQRKIDLEKKEEKGELSSEETFELRGIENYLLHSSLESYNKKKVVRSSIEIGEDLTDILGNIGEIAVTSATGAGSAVKVGVSTAVAIEKFSRIGFRKLKQLARDKHLPFTNQDKTSKAKNQKYNDNAYYILRGIGDLPELDQKNEDIKSQYRHQMLNATATGCSMLDLGRTKDIFDARDQLIKGMKQRSF